MPLLLALVLSQRGTGTAADSLLDFLLPVLSVAAALVRAESRMFGNFSETKNFVTIGTWAFVLAFLLLSAIVALKQ